MNLHQTLKAYNEANVLPEQELILREANNILSNSAESDLSILTELGLDRNIKKYKYINSQINQAKDFDEVYDISVIKKMAVNYGLRFLPAAKYKGTIDPLLPSMLNSFINRHSIIVGSKEKAFRPSIWETEKVKDTGFYILAPASSFELEEKPKDPIIFYKINESKYAFVHKWGNDLSNWRLLTNWFFKTSWHLHVTFSLFVILGVSVLALVTGQKEVFILLSFLIVNMLISEVNSNEDIWDSQYR